MATKRMLIDAAHPEETRVAIVDGERLTDYDVEIASRRQLKGNIYLAKVTRVEPSLQAAFVDYGGNRHGFLAFNEIHPDYYQIPVADREALLAEQAEAEKACEARASENGGDQGEQGDTVDTVGGVDEDIDVHRPRPSPRHYKIQEVIKRRQILLVQVTKEERGTKGAALTTYLSLAGRYCVLMPNTTRGGGISRKITSATDRKRLKKILSELGMPEGMAVIVRTAGSERTKAEIRRDYDYLIRLWNSIRELTLSSMAPTLVYEEANLIKRSLRDLYDRDTGEILVEGEGAYRIAKDFMKLFIPSHAKRVQLYEDGSHMPLFQRHRVENELEAMHQPTVQLKSGGSIVLNPTEALVAVDVNSGRATRERHIEETALRTNLEACDEVARQLRLRDLAGLIVVDFIDMEVSRNQTQVERRLKEAMKADRARVQLGRISPFGLLELSRQRLRPSLFESSFEVCPFCAGAGVRRSTESTALAIFRRIEQEGVQGRAGEIRVTVPTAVALYLLNQKRRALVEMERRFRVTIAISGDDALVPPAFTIESSGEPAPLVGAEAGPAVEEAGEAAAEVPADATSEAEDRDEGTKKSRRRRPRRRKRTDAETEARSEAAAVSREREAEDEAEEDDTEDEAEEGEDAQPDSDEQSDEDRQSKKRRRRGKRGGRRRTRRPEAEQDNEQAEVQAEVAAGEQDEGSSFAGLPGPGTAISLDEGFAEEGSAEGDAVPSVPADVAVLAEVAAEPRAAELADAEVEPGDGEPGDGEPGDGEPARLEEVALAVDKQADGVDAAVAVLDQTEPAATEQDRDQGEAVSEPVADDASPREPEPESDTIQEPEHRGDLGGVEPEREPEPAAASEPGREQVERLAEAQDQHAPTEPERRAEAEPAQSESESEQAAARVRAMNTNASRAVVVNVGEDEGDVGDEGPRRGWWQRLLNSNS